MATGAGTEIGTSRGPLVRTVYGTTSSSRLLHLVDRVTSRAMVACGVALAVVAFLIVGAFWDYPGSWLRVFHVIVAAMTLLMVFVIQHTQSREQTATQMKLDELIRALPQADDLLVHIEAASDDELIQREQRDLDHHGAVRDSP
jgi:low affinity Fe/Cu permease